MKNKTESKTYLLRLDKETHYKLKLLSLNSGQSIQQLIHNLIDKLVSKTNLT